MKILVYRPLVCPRNSAFEAQALIYCCLQQLYGYKFRLLIADSDSFQSDELEIERFQPSRCDLHLSRIIPQIPKALKRQISEFQPDLILGLDPSLYSQGLQAVAAAQKFSIPYLFDVSKTICDTRNPISRRLLSRQLRRLDKIKTGVIATGPKCLERLSLIQGFPEKLINGALILGHPFDENTIQNKTDYRRDGGVMTVVSRLIVEKGIHYILEAVGPILKKNPSWSLQFVGRGPLENYILSYAMDNELESQILCRGEVPHGEIPSILFQSDIFINHAISTPAWEEYFGIANIEAMAAGLPCVVSDSGSITWVIREEGAATIVGQRNTAAINKAVTDLVQSAEYREKIGKMAKAYASMNYSLNVLTNRYSSYCANLID